MKEGASNCVERHLNLNDCDTSLLGKCCNRSDSNAVPSYSAELDAPSFISSLWG